MKLLLFTLLFFFFFSDLFIAFYFLPREHPLIFVESSFGGVEFLNFCLFVKLLSFSLNLSEILAGHSNHAGMFFPFINLSISCHTLLACRVSSERSAVNCMGFPLYVTCCFSLTAF